MTEHEIVKNLENIARNFGEQLRMQESALCDMQSRMNALVRVLKELEPILGPKEANLVAKYDSYQRAFAESNQGRLQSSC
jgi:hypothetical protein